jgi:class 3 adenylate cyclase/tetratricopeptide (TPR) repeat protein
VAVKSVCPSCGAEIEPGARFCAACGTALVGTCPACGAETRVGAQFCPSCGHRLDRVATKEEERKLVTVLFADLTGSTALGEQLDPERLRALLREYFSAMASTIERWGGTVEKFIGDAVMAVFGIPQMHEDDAERALRAALDMQVSLEEMNPQILERHGVRLSMRVGVNTGEVIAGAGGDQLMVTGDAVNVAARLQQTAEPGQVAAGERTYLATRGALVFEPLRERTLKGKAASVPAWRLVEPGELVRPRGVPGLVTRVVGRHRELELLESLYTAAVEEGRPRLVTIRGEAGVGKTRLTEEFLSWARSASVYRGRCLPYGQGISYWALREMLWALAGIVFGDSGTVAGEKLRKLVVGAFEGSDAEPEDIERVTYALAITAGISLEGNPLNRMSPESVGEELGLAWPRFLSALAADGPVVVVVEDLHWAEPPLLDMIEHLVSRAAGPILVVATARHEFAELRPGWSERRAMSLLGLEALTEAQAEELVHELLPSVGEALRRMVLEAAEGNPFFAEEIVRHLIDRGVLMRRDSEVVESSRPPDLAIPDTIRALLATRIDGLPAGEKRALQDASVVGRIFWAAALERMRPDAPVRAALRALEDRGLIVARPASELAGQTAFGFNHGLTREVAYTSIPRARRARAHADVARWTEELAGGRRGEFVELVAHHYEQAARPEDVDLAWPDDPARREEVRSKAVATLLEAGEAARTRFAIDQAIGFAERALALSPTDGERLQALGLQARAGHAGVRVVQALPWYLEALDLAERIGDREALHRLSAHATLMWSRYGGAFPNEDWKPQAVEIVRRALEEFGDDADTFETGALLVGRAGLRYWGMTPRPPRDEARRDMERAIEIAERLDSPYLLSYGLDALVALVVEDGFCGSADLGERTLAVAGRILDRVEAHEMLVTSARCFEDAGRFEEAIQVAREAAVRAASLSPHHRVHAAFVEANHLLPTGRLRELLEATGEVPGLVEEEGGHTCGLGSQALAAYALALFESGDGAAATRAVGLLDQTEVSVQPVPYAHYRVIDVIRPIVGREDAAERLEKAGSPKDLESGVWRLRAALSIHALGGDPATWEPLAAEARELGRSACAPFLGWIADWGDAVLLARRGRSRDAVQVAKDALSPLEAFGDRYAAARLMVDLMPFLQEQDVASSAADVVPRLEDMGASTSAAEALRFLR